MEATLVPIDKVHPNPKNPRRDLGDLTELAESIASAGMIQPLVVTKNGAGFDLIIGARRLAAAKQIGLKQVPVVLWGTPSSSEAEVLEAMLVENLQREDLAPIDEARALKQLVDLGREQKEIASRIGRAPSHVSQRLSLLRLPEKAIHAVNRGDVSVEDARELTKLVEMPKRLEAALSHAKDYGGVQRAVALELEDHKRKTQMGELEQKLKSDGVKILKAFEPHSRGIKGRWLKQADAYYNFIEITPAQHKKEPCHAAVIKDGYGTPKALYLCTDPSRHAKRGASALKTPAKPKSESGSASKRAESAKSRKQREELEATEASRLEFMRGLMKKPRKEGILEFLTRQLAADLYTDGTDQAIQILYPELDEATNKARKDAVDSKVLMGAAEREPVKTALAIALGIGEEATRYALNDGRSIHYWKSAAPVIARHYEFLMGLGYQETELERTKLQLSETKGAAKAPATVRRTKTKEATEDEKGEFKSYFDEE